ncbi:sporulation protein Cse60 [Saccharicrinis aurantiacus]|uniref:sporulation protein Cse60 n=1 Tax=Saccharicrinis aurantiacus TaxID=1849719 RepID=UPI000837BA9D|nr:sporulation protein Cse60 [Saccharicrinis aurantiacus]
MERTKTKHFQYTGVDDFDVAIDEQINAFLVEAEITGERLIDIKYQAHSSQGVNNYSALVVYVD